METGTLVTFAAYLVGMLAIGATYYRKTRTADDYLLGNRGLPPFATALSAQASDMSGWLLMGLPGAIFLGGAGEMWMVAGLFAGTWLNWRYVAPRLRRRTEELGAITLPAFFERRFGGHGALGAVSAVVTFFFFSIYAASGLVASGLLFESVLGVRYEVAVGIGAAVVLGYTALGGFLAVCWTDVVQGLMMLAALIALPVLAYLVSEGAPVLPEPSARVGLQFPMSGAGEGGLVAAVSAASWGLGYFGQPHILVRFMAIDRSDRIVLARRIATVWVALCFLGAVLVGWIGTLLYPWGLERAERVFIHLVRDFADPWIGGVLLAAILAAIMSTMDSQLLVSSSALSEDLYARLVRPRAVQGERVLVGRVAAVGVTAAAVLLAMDRESTVLGLVRYAWGGLGASFGPLVLFGLSSRRVPLTAALAALVAGAGTTVVWNTSGLGASLYEIVPGFAAGCLVLWIASRSREGGRGWEGGPMERHH